MRVLSIRISIFIAHFYLSQGTIFKGHLRNHAELLIIIGFVSGGTILHTNYNAHSEMVSSFNLLRVKIMNFLFAMTINTVNRYMEIIGILWVNPMLYVGNTISLW